MNNLIAFGITDNRWINWQISSKNRIKFFDKLLKSENNNETTFVYPSNDVRKISLKMDGDMVCATYPDFTNIQESIVGFGKTAQEAITQLILSNK